MAAYPGHSHGDALDSKILKESERGPFLGPRANRVRGITFFSGGVPLRDIYFPACLCHVLCSAVARGPPSKPLEPENRRPPLGACNGVAGISLQVGKGPCQPGRRTEG